MSHINEKAGQTKPHKFTNMHFDWKQVFFCEMNLVNYRQINIHISKPCLFVEDNDVSSPFIGIPLLNRFLQEIK